MTAPSELDLATLQAARSSIERAALAATNGRLQEAEEAMARAERRLAELKMPWHSRPVRKTREAFDKLKEALLAPKHPSPEDREDGLRSRDQKLATALRACSAS